MGLMDNSEKKCFKHTLLAFQDQAVAIGQALVEGGWLGLDAGL